MDKTGKLSVEALEKVANLAIDGHQQQQDSQFSQNLVNFLSQPSQSPKRQEKVEKATALGLMGQPEGEAGLPSDIPSAEQTPPQE